MKKKKCLMALMLSAVMATSGMYGSVPGLSVCSAETVFAEENEEAVAEEPAEETSTASSKETKENYVNKIVVKYVGGDKDIGDMVESDELEVTGVLKSGDEITLTEDQYDISNDIITSMKQKVTISYTNAAGKVKKAYVNVAATLVITKVTASLSEEVSLDAGEPLNTGMFTAIGYYKDIDGEYHEVSIPSDEFEISEEYTSSKSTKTSVRVTYKNSAGKEIKSNTVSIPSDLVVTKIRAEYVGDSTSLDIGDEITVDDIEVIGTNVGKDEGVVEGYYLDSAELTKESNTFKVKYDNSIGKTLTASVRVDAGALVKSIDAIYIGGTKNIGDSIDPSEFNVIGTLKSGGTTQLTATSVSPEILEKERQTVKVCYENSLGKTLTKSVSVDATNRTEEISVSVNAKETDLVVGAVVKPAWFKVTATKADGKTKTVPSSQLTFYPEILNNSGMVTVYYDGVEEDVPLDVIVPSTELDIVLKDTSYKPGYKLTKDDMEVYAKTSSGYQTDVTDDLSTISTSDGKVTVTWRNEQGVSVSRSVNFNVGESVRSIKITQSNKDFKVAGVSSRNLNEYLTVTKTTNKGSNIPVAIDDSNLTIKSSDGTIINGQGELNVLLANKEKITAEYTDEYGDTVSATYNVKAETSNKTPISGFAKDSIDVVNSKKVTNTIKFNLSSKILKNCSVTAISADTSIATATVSDKTVTVKGVGVGSTKITITVEGTNVEKGSKSFKVNVSEKASNTKVTITAANKSVVVGNTVNIAATVAPSNASITYSSDDTGIATIDSNGKVTGIKAGKTTITISATSGTKTATKKVTITVTQKGSSSSSTSSSSSSGSSTSKKGTTSNVDKPTITLNESKASVQVGGIYNVKKTVGGSNPTVTYTSDNTNVAKVDANGKVTAVKKGKCKITVTATNSAGKATAKVTIQVVPKKATKLNASKNKISLQYVKNTTVKQTIEVTPFPEDAEVNLSYSKTGTGFSINKSGVITASSTGGNGTVTITDTNSGTSTTISVSVEGEKKKPTVKSVELIKHPTVYIVNSNKKLVPSTQKKTVKDITKADCSLKVTYSDGSTTKVSPDSVSMENTNTNGGFNATIKWSIKLDGQTWSNSASGGVIKKPSAGSVALNGKG